MFYQSRNAVGLNVHKNSEKAAVESQGPLEQREESDSPVNSTASQTPPPMIKKEAAKPVSVKSEDELDKLREANMKQIAEFRASFLAPKSGGSEPKPKEEPVEVRSKITIKLPSQRINKIRAVEGERKKREESKGSKEVMPAVEESKQAMFNPHLDTFKKQLAISVIKQSSLTSNHSNSSVNGACHSPSFGLRRRLHPVGVPSLISKKRKHMVLESLSVPRDQKRLKMNYK